MVGFHISGDIDDIWQIIGKKSGFWADVQGNDSDWSVVAVGWLSSSGFPGASRGYQSLLCMNASGHLVLAQH
jgi:hypothetical protein